jgi:hypothetical protein
MNARISDWSTDEWYVGAIEVEFDDGIYVLISTEPSVRCIHPTHERSNEIERARALAFAERIVALRKEE